MNTSLEVESEEFKYSVTSLQFYAFLGWFGTSACVGYCIGILSCCIQIYDASFLTLFLDCFTSALGFLWLEFLFWVYQINEELQNKSWHCAHIQGALDVPFIFGPFFIFQISLLRWSHLKFSPKPLPGTVENLAVVCSYLMGLCYIVMCMMTLYENEYSLGITEQVKT